MNKKNLTEFEAKVLYENATEPPYANKYWNFWKKGLYIHKISKEPLFSSYDKYAAECGWPTFYKPIKDGNIDYVEDNSRAMTRTEIRDHNTDTHLGHVFPDLSKKNKEKFQFRRYCLNSAALDFVSEEEIWISDNEIWQKAWNETKQKNDKYFSTITIAGGCFWGVQQLLRRLEGIYDTKVGYANFKDEFETVNYKQVCELNTGAVEVVNILYNKEVLPLEEILALVFSHVDPTTLNRQGNDVGSQYRTGVYFSDKQDEEIIKRFFAEKIQPLHTKKVVTEILPLKKFVLAEEYHQDYLIKNPNGYCHIKL